MGISPLSGNFNTATKVENEDVSSTPTLDDAYAAFRFYPDTEDKVKLFGNAGPPLTWQEFIGDVGKVRQELREMQRLNIDLEKAYEQSRMALGNLEGSLELGSEGEQALQAFAKIASDNRQLYVSRLIDVEKLRRAYFHDQGNPKLAHELHRTLPIISLMKSFMGNFGEYYQAGWIQMKENYSPVRIFLEAAVNQYDLEGQEVVAMEEYISFI